jgi:ABC-2 type transport system permease protein
MKTFFALFKARNIEFWRDRAGLGWAFAFPLLIIIACALAFSKPDLTVFRIGLLNAHINQTEAEKNLPAWLKQPYVEVLYYQDAGKGQQRISHHQLDLLINAENKNQYWINPESGTSLAAEQFLLGQLAKNNLPAPEKATISGRAVRYADWVMPGVLGMNMMFSALFGIGYVIVRYRRSGVLKRLQATPITPAHFLSANIASRLWIVVSVNFTIYIGCLFALDLLMLGNYLYLLLIMILGSTALISIGLLVAARTESEELAGGLLNVFTWPMLFLSEVWFSLDNAPDWMQQLSLAMPLTHIIKALRMVMIDGEGFAAIAPHLLWLVVMTVVFTAIAAKLFRWHRNS